MLNSLANGKFKYFSKPLNVFQVLFKANFIFKDFSRQDFSSTFQVCANPVKNFHYLRHFKFLFYVNVSMGCCDTKEFSLDAILTTANVQMTRE